MIILNLSEPETLADIMQNNPHLTKDEILELLPSFSNSASYIDYLSVDEIMKRYEDFLTEQEIQKLNEQEQTTRQF